MSKDLNARFIFLGIILGALSFFAKGTMVMLAVIIITAMLLWHYLPMTEHDFLVKLFIAGISVRILIFCILYIISIMRGGSGELTPDSRLYFLKALSMSKLWSGQTESFLWYDERCQKEGHTYLLAFYYLLIGYKANISNPPSIFSDKLINCLIGTITAVPIFYLAKDIFGKVAAKITAVFVVFYPSLVLWSMTNNRDTINIFLVSLILFCVLKFQREKRLCYFIFILLPLLLLKTIRPYIFYSVLFSIISTLLISLWTNSKRKAEILLIFIASVIILLNFTPYGRQIENRVFNLQAIWEKVYGANQAVLSQEGSMYKIYDDVFLAQSIPVALKLIWALFKGWFYFMLVPFPWLISSLVQLFAFPQMIIWYLLLPFVFIGIIFAIRYKLKDSLIVLIYLFIVTSGFALTEGNVGSVLRHRDLVSPFYSIFAAVGILLLFDGGVLFEEKK